MKIDCKLEKDTYNAGETVKGKLFIKTNKVLNVRNLNFSVLGKERWEEHPGHGGPASGFAIDRWSEKYDIFYSEDLSAFLNSIDASAHNNGDIQIPEGEFAIPFHFSIPSIF
jgi:Arrestin (or S-antigen), N-terminal domain